MHHSCPVEEFVAKEIVIPKPYLAGRTRELCRHQLALPLRALPATCCNGSHAARGQRTRAAEDRALRVAWPTPRGRSWLL